MDSRGNLNSGDASDPEHDIDFTGERVVPGKVDPDLFNEHFARYVYARFYCIDRTVLDTGCGVGYGTDYLAQSASHVVGVDNESEAVEFAVARYRSENTAYLVGDCQRLPFASRTFDVVTSFELIEHLPDANAYLDEVRRVLRQGGIFLVSTPNRPVYHEHLADVRNPFHVREWDHDEFVSLLKNYFGFIEVLGENHLAAIGIGRPGTMNSARTEINRDEPVQSADYFVCICSNKEQETRSMVYVPASANVLLERERHVRALANDLKARETYLARIQPELEQMTAWATKLNAELAAAQADCTHLQAQLGESQAKVQELGVLWSKTTRWKRALVFSALAPLDWAVGFLVVATELTARLWRQLTSAPEPPPAGSGSRRASIVIVTWEGKDLLAESLPHLVRAVKFDGDEHEIIVVDNGSTDGTEEYVRTHFPEIRLIRSGRNLYFGGGNNLGIREASNDILVLINNDMIVHEDFLGPLLQPFRENDVFAVASQVSLADPRKPREETGKTRAMFNGCDFDWRHEPISASDEQQNHIPVFWGHGGAVAIDRRKFLSLGGFDTLYDPFYVEDADLSYQAWKLGWRCLLAVNSKVIHKHRSSTRRFGKPFVTKIVRRNQQLFIWKNVGDIRKLVGHFGRAFRGRIRLAGIPGVGIQLELRAYLGAVKRLPVILHRRFQLASRIVRSDQEVLELANQTSRAATLSAIDFSRCESDEQLGGGWYPVEDHTNASYRWMGQKASLYLRAPAESADLSICGYVPSTSHYQASSLTLTVSCNGERAEFVLKEGIFERRYSVKGLKVGAAVLTELAVDRVIQPRGADRRSLGIMCTRVALLPGQHSPTDRSLTGVVCNHIPGLDAVKTDSSGEGSEQLRILIVCAYLPCLGVHSGGNTMFNLIRSLSKRHRLTVLSFYEREEEKEEFAPLLSRYCEQLHVIYRGQTFETPNVLGLKPPEIIHEFYHARMERLVREHLLASRFDVIQCEFLQTGHFASVEPSIPAVLTNHELLSLSYANRFHALPWTSPGKLRAMISWMRMFNYEEKLLRRFSAVVVLTQTEREFLARYAPNIMVYDHATGVDCDFFYPTNEVSEKDSVIFVGNFRHGPNVGAMSWFLDRVWPTVRASHHDARLYIVGGNPPPNLQQAHGRDGVVVTGWVEDVRPYLQRSAVFVAPVFEGVGLRGKVLEAWAMRKPVIGTSLSFEGLSPREGRTCFIADDPEQFAARVCELLENEELATKMGTMAREVAVNSFSWDAFGEMYDKIYQDILQPSDRSNLDRDSVLKAV